MMPHTLLIAICARKNTSSIDPSAVVAGQLFLETVRCILFGTGRAQYGQTPPIGGAHRQDLARAAELVGLNIITQKIRT